MLLCEIREVVSSVPALPGGAGHRITSRLAPFASSVEHMHRSRIGVVLIDHPAMSYEAAATFWAGATGHDRSEPKPGNEPPYESLSDLAGGVHMVMQELGGQTAARVHLDIETDDVEAETARLLDLGALLVEQRDGYAILADPGGVPFCVVPVQTGAAFEEHATTWP